MALLLTCLLPRVCCASVWRANEDCQGAGSLAAPRPSVSDAAYLWDEWNLCETRDPRHRREREEGSGRKYLKWA